jgi:hypothetical protein
MIEVVGSGSVEAQTMKGRVVAEMTRKGAPVHLGSKHGELSLRCRVTQSSISRLPLCWARS